MERRKFTREFKLEAVRLIKDRGVSYVQASQDLNVHPSQLRDWVKKFSEDAQHAFPGHGQMKPDTGLTINIRNVGSVTHQLTGWLPEPAPSEQAGYHGHTVLK